MTKVYLGSKCGICKSDISKASLSLRRIYRCRSCRNEYQLKWQKVDRKTEKYRKRRAVYNSLRRKLGLDKLSNRKSSKKNKIKFPQKFQARQLLKRAVNRGEVVKPETCSKCGEKPALMLNGRSAIEGHHYKGYDFPLDVIWLCHWCHRETDRALKKI